MTARVPPDQEQIPIRLLPGAERILQAALAGHWSEARLYKLRLQAERIVLASGFDELICLKNLAFTPFEYQVRAARTALRRFRGRGLLCDEVGLGKTIEAGLVLKEYALRQMVSRVLILTPPALVEQWQEELALKFGLDDFITNTDPRFRALGGQAWAQFPRVVASLATARLKRHRSEITKLDYDLIIVDEAHHLKNRSSVSWKFVNQLQPKYILLLTATPVQNKLDELYNLVTLLKPGQLESPRKFRQQFVVQGDPRLPKNRGLLRELLADVMVRHSRSQVRVDLPPRQAHTVRLSLTEPEQALYNEVSDLIRQGLVTDDQGSLRVNTFTLRVLQREIGSSPQAAEPTLRALAKKRLLQPHREQLLSLADRAARIQDWAKVEALEKLLRSILGSGTPEKVLIFTHFLRTLELLRARLEEMGISFVIYHGRLSFSDKNQAVQDFEQRAQVLLSTEAAGEGRNLQFCRTMVNFDLPWNPLRIEQRVGRIHRIGQERPVRIYNLSARGTVEDYILDILDRKLNMFELVIGEMDMILGHMSDERDFEELVLEVWGRSQTPGDLQAGFEHLGEALSQARQSYGRAQEYDQALFGEDFATE
ncbi:MAG: DEAD/DEAH box helicase [Chloroflexia bacterium]|nr:DEAD/DEAH box helicase [Chloroflexia bacterium]